MPNDSDTLELLEANEYNPDDLEWQEGWDEWFYMIGEERAEESEE